MKSIISLVLFGVLASVSYADNPPGNELIEIKTPTRTFNHVNDYAIQDGELWYRLRNASKAPWQKFSFDRTKNEVPVEIKADGANLMVLDSNREIHYKKILKEKRDFRGRYSFRDLSAKNNWYSSWYSLPLLSLFRNPFRNHRLGLPPGVTSWAVSHRGKYNAYFNDARNGKHPEFPMVTTVYAIPNDGKDIVYADPYLLGGFSQIIPGPDPAFKGIRVEASASMLFLLGSINGVKRMYTRLADFDTLGKNPFLPGFWIPVLAAKQGWAEVTPPGPLYGLARITDNITIFQDGVGNSARELRIEGFNAKGVYGYYSKHIDDLGWAFNPI